MRCFHFTKTKIIATSSPGNLVPRAEDRRLGERDWSPGSGPTSYPGYYLRSPRASGQLGPFSYPEPFLRAVNGARQGALAKSISNWHLIGYNEGYCSNTGYILLPCFHGIRLWIWPEPLVAPRVRRALGTRMARVFPCEFSQQIWGITSSFPGLLGWERGWGNN